MSVLAVQHILKGNSGLPTDVYVNTWHFGTTDVLLDMDALTNPANGIVKALKDFYESAGSGGLAIKDRLASTINPAIRQIKAYRLNDPKPRVPLLDETSVIAGIGGNALPSEVSICASFQAVKTSGVAQARRRNRVFLGPLSQGVMSVTANHVRPGNDFLELVSSKMANLRNDADAAPNWSWIVYSSLLGVGNTAAVQNGWVDNAFDTQRRRGPDPSSRVLWADA